jgi:hypothetical protein
MRVPLNQQIFIHYSLEMAMIITTYGLVFLYMGFNERIILKLILIRRLAYESFVEFIRHRIVFLFCIRDCGNEVRGLTKYGEFLGDTPRQSSS